MAMAPELVPEGEQRLDISEIAQHYEHIQMLALQGIKNRYNKSC